MRLSDKVPMLFLLFLGSGVSLADGLLPANDAGGLESPVMLYQCASTDRFKFVEYIIVETGTILFEIHGINARTRKYMTSSSGEFHFEKGTPVPDSFGQSPQIQEIQFRIAKAILNNGRFSFVYRGALDSALAATPKEECPPSITSMVPKESP